MPLLIVHFTKVIPSGKALYGHLQLPVKWCTEWHKVTLTKIFDCFHSTLSSD